MFKFIQYTNVIISKRFDTDPSVLTQLISHGVVSSLSLRVSFERKTANSPDIPRNWRWKPPTLILSVKQLCHHDPYPPPSSCSELSQTLIVGEKKDSTLHRAYGVKLPLLRAVWADQGLILPLEKLLHFFLGP